MHRLCAKVLAALFVKVKENFTIDSLLLECLLVDAEPDQAQEGSDLLCSPLPSPRLLCVDAQCQILPRGRLIDSITLLLAVDMNFDIHRRGLSSPVRVDCKGLFVCDKGPCGSEFGPV